MKNTVLCPKCGEEIEVQEALKHQFEEQVKLESNAKHQADLEQVRQSERESVAKSFTKELGDEKDRNKKLSSQLEELLDETRKLRRRDEEREIEMKRKLLDEEEKIRKEAGQKFAEDHALKDLEKDKKLSEALAQVEILRSKIEKGSQETQGEAFEIELERKLRLEFPVDLINEVKKGQRGADLVQTVIDKLGRNCGVILWECKNAKWDNGWIPKLKENQRQVKADSAVLVSVNLPDGIDGYSYKDGVWVTSVKAYLPLALALRYHLISIFHVRQSLEGKDEKMKVLFQYLTGIEFKQRIEGIAEAFTRLQEEIEKEKRFFGTKWARQEKEMRKVIDHTQGMHGDLQAIIGKSLPDIKVLSLDPGEE